MTQNDAVKFYNCQFCIYKTKRRYDLKRHQNAKHKCENVENNEEKNIGQNVSPCGQNVSPCGQNVSPCGQNVSPNQNICKKCNKSYITRKNLLIHEKKCKGVDELTCPRCMISFTTRQAKSKHMKKDNCEARSIIYARTPNIQNIETQNVTNNNITNNIKNLNHTTNNYISINNYGNERLDYLNYDTMLNIFKKIYNIPTLLTKEIHFNEEFPENNNIQYENKTHALVKVNDDLVLKDLNLLAEELVKEKADKIQKFAENNKKQICTSIELEKYNEIVELLFNYIILKEPTEQYRKQVKNIKDMITTSKIKLTKYVDGS